MKTQKKWLKSLSFKIIPNTYEKNKSTTPFTLKGHILLFSIKLEHFLQIWIRQVEDKMFFLSSKSNRPWTREL
jgi:hypothetical protein